MAGLSPSPSSFFFLFFYCLPAAIFHLAAAPLMLSSRLKPSTSASATPGRGAGHRPAETHDHRPGRAAAGWRVSGTLMRPC